MASKYWVANNPNSEINDTKAQKVAELSATGTSLAEIDLLDGVSSSTDQINAGLGACRIASFGYSLADTNGAAVAYQDNDCLVELGALDTSTVSGMQTPTKILIKSVYLNETVAMGSALTGEILVSATAGTATNSPVDTPTEIVGTGVTYNSSQGIGAAVSVSEADYDLHSVGAQADHPNLIVASTLKNVYLAATSAYNNAAVAGRGNIIIEYVVF